MADSGPSNERVNSEISEDKGTTNSSETSRHDNGVKFKIGTQVSQEDEFEIEQSVGKNYGRQFSQDTIASRLDAPRQRHISAVVQPNVYGGGGIMRKTHSSNSLNSMAKPKIQQGKNGMVLQLVLPNGIQNGGISFEPNFLPVTQDGIKRRKIEETNGISPQNSMLFNGYPTPGISPGAFEYPNNLGSIKGPETVMSEAISHITPTPHEEKSRVTREFISIQYSLLYGIFLICLGWTIYITDIIYDEFYPLKEVFSYYIVCVSFIFIIYIMLDVMFYMKKRKKYNETLEQNKTDEVEFVEHPEGGIHLSIPLPKASRLEEPLPHYYCLSTGRHGGNMYLKIGAAVFCLGHLVHSGLIVGYQIVYLSSDGDMWGECTSIELLVLDFIYPVYSFLLLFFIFKYSNIIISRNIVLARFGFMHCMASGLCFWVHTILRETFDALAFYGSYNNTEYDTTNVGQPGQSVRMWTGICDGEHGMAIIYQNFSPYLYPFSVEFNILVVGILYIVWSSIASCAQNFEHNDDAAERARDCASDFNESPEKESNITIHVDCHSSSRGIFSALVVVIILIVSIILFFVAISDERFQEMGLTYNTATHLAVNLVLGIAVVWAYFHTTKLDVNHHTISPLDDVLLYVCVPMFLLNFIFSVYAAAQFGNGLYIAYLVIMTAQVVIQTTFIVDGLRRCSNSRESRQKKPGREIIVFLVITNVAMWLVMTFEVTSHDLHDDRYEFYGKVLWSILGHVWLPLMMFYRFHASACLVDMWKYCYEKASH